MLYSTYAYKNDINLKVVTIRILAFLGGCILALLKAACSLPKKELDVNKKNLLVPWEQSYNRLGQIRNQVYNVLCHLFRKVYLLCQHNSWCSGAPNIPKIMLAYIIYQGLSIKSTHSTCWPLKFSYLSPSLYFSLAHSQEEMDQTMITDN